MGTNKYIQINSLIKAKYIMKHPHFMIAILFQIILFCSVGKRISAKLEECVMTDKQKKFDVLPGTGWDNLENTEKGRILELNFSSCHFSDDNKYLLPRDVFLTPMKSSKIDLFTESFDHYFNYSSILSRSMKAEASDILSSVLSGQFSKENNEVKGYQLESKSKMTRVQLRYNIYKSKIEPDSPLSQSFKDRIIHLAKWIKKFNDTLYSSYLADMIIRDFGTHVIRSIDAGAVLSKIDILNQNYVRQHRSNLNVIGASASASFIGFFKLNTEYQDRVNREDVNIYNRNIDRKIINTYGGAMFGPETKVDKWIESVNDNLVAIDRSGDPIYYVLSRKVLPMLSSNIIHKISKLLQNSVNRYYSANTRKGCVDFLSPNFNSDANVDDGTCISPTVNFNFGGIYRTCDGPNYQCMFVKQLNPVTGSYSCPDGFSSVMLHSGLNECQRSCSTSMIFFSDCYTTCSYFKIFWCYPQKFGLNHNGYRFGGFISAQMPKCPDGYLEMHLGSTAKLCITTNASSKDKHAIEFGGFFSCSVGNPLAESFFKSKQDGSSDSHLTSRGKWQQHCAEGYVAHVATIDQNCQISFCTETNKFSLGPKPILKKLPFIEESVSVNQSTPMYLYSKKGELFIQNFQLFDINNETIETKDTESNVLSKIILLVSFVLMVSMLLIPIIMIRRMRRRRYGF